MSQPFFSVITPVYNRQADILGCVQSVFDQTFVDYELILINDGSTDKTLEIIQHLPDDPRLIRISYDQNKGVNYARNRGIERAQGRFIYFLDSDDALATPQSLASIAELITLHPGYAHYLFRVDDRENDPSLPAKSTEYQYTDWLSGKVNGDYAHVITPGSFEGKPFVEAFRAFESLNWLRVVRGLGKGLYLPFTVVSRDRNRADALSLKFRSSDRTARLSRFTYLGQYLAWYADDFRQAGLQGLLDGKVREAVLLGTSLGQHAATTQLINQYVPSSVRRILFHTLNNSLSGAALSWAIEAKSRQNQRKALKEASL
jgi:glycosyltransferase involved in cell wall biosynthesis